MIVSLVAAAFALQQSSVTVQVSSEKGASVRVISRGDDDSTTRHDDRGRKLLTATPQQVATAFADPAARLLLASARAARLNQDSTIGAYTATTHQRMTLGLALARFGRDHIFFRHESAAHVRWSRGAGAQIDVSGKRTVIPMLGGSAEVDMESMLSPVPYYPGRDALYMGLDVAKANVAADELVHPLANGAEALYTYRTGDSVSFRLPDGTTIQLRELEVRPRKPDWRLSVGSLWFDTKSGQLVRAAYRMSRPFDFIEDNEYPGIVGRALLRPAEARISGVAIEYGLYQGRYWLPRSQVGEGDVRVGVMRMPMRIEERFEYAGATGIDTMSTLPVRARTPRPRVDTSKYANLRGDERWRARTAEHARVDSIIHELRTKECAETGSSSQSVRRYGGALHVDVRIPCDSAALANSPELSKSIFDSGEQIFGDAERDALLAKAMTMMPDVGFAMERPQVGWGFDLLRYNRVEGLSSGLEIKQSFGSSFTAFAIPRIGLADQVPGGELFVERTTGVGASRIGGYRRLAAANDWGNPLAFGSALSAFMFGRDEGLYYRTTGVEVSGERDRGLRYSWRAFFENESDAAVHTNVSVPQLLGSSGFEPSTNIVATRAQQAGLAARHVGSYGLDPNAFRLLTDIRVEAATGDFDYTRLGADFTLSHALGRSLAAAVTAGAGTSGGSLSPQRLFYVGGTGSVRGQSAGAMSGNAYWLGRAELGTGSAGMRKLVFADFGWAGDRRHLDAVGRPASGVGAAFSFLDGLLRVDLARGIYPRKQWTTMMYLEGRF